jgi:hypothetical protein
MTMGLRCLLPLLVCLPLACGSQTEWPIIQDPQPPIDPPLPPAPPDGSSGTEVRLDARRSLIVTDQIILDRFSFERVLGRIADTSGEPGLDARTLYREWWSSEQLPACAAGINGFPVECPRREGDLTTTDPFREGGQTPDGYLAVALVNRFDLAPDDGSSCGEYRMVFAKRSGQQDDNDRNLIIFEAVMPNPAPLEGLSGCRPIVELFAGLSAVDDASERARRLEGFYFDGVVENTHVPAPVCASQLGLRGGQIRTNQFMESPWMLRQFAVARDGAGHVGIRPMAVGGNPFGALFDPGNPAPAAARFRDRFVAHLGSLLVRDVNLLALDAPGEFAAGQSQQGRGEQPAAGEINDYLVELERTPASDFAGQIAAELTRRSSRLTVEQLMRRATARSCAGCHFLAAGTDLGDGMTLPGTLPFTHVSEQRPEPGPDGPRFRISRALETAFLPFREQRMRAFLSR